LEEFSKVEGNFKNVPVFLNKAFPINNSKTAFLDPGFFGEQFYRQNKNMIRKLTYADCHVDNRIKTFAEFRNDNFPLTLAVWFKLCGAVLCWRRVFGGGGPRISTTLPNFFNSVKKRSKKFRKVIESSVEGCVVVGSTTSAKTFFQLKNTVCMEQKCKKWLGSWKLICLPNNFRNFLFNCRNNKLPLNNRLSKYIKEISPLCTFCKIQDPETSNRDGFKHCFFDCQMVKKILVLLKNKLGLNSNLLSDDFQTLYWYGYNDNILDHQQSFLIFFDSFRYMIYKFRLRHVVPLYSTLEREIVFFILKICDVKGCKKHIFEQHVTS
jgi:hypothetical protein